MYVLTNSEVIFLKDTIQEVLETKVVAPDLEDAYIILESLLSKGDAGRVTVEEGLEAIERER